MCTEIITYQSNSGSTKEVASLYGATPYGNYLLYKQELSMKEIGVTDEEITAMIDTSRSLYKQAREVKRIKVLMEKNKGFRQLVFNNFFMKSMLELVGTLRCVYCGKPDLTIYHWMKSSKNRKNMATVDHFNAKSNGGGAFDVHNCVIACWKCNNDKQSKVWGVRTLRYLSHYGDFKILVKKLLG
tara:strand:- start:227 stop:781 length:555 start_codon:yes stop_codon:yes gene_type:complete